MKRLILIFTYACVALIVLGDQSVTGSRIAKMDTYDFNWDDENAVANVIADSKALTGKHCRIESIGGSYYLIDFYGV